MCSTFVSYFPKEKRKQNTDHGSKPLLILHLTFMGNIFILNNYREEKIKIQIQFPNVTGQ